MSLPGKKSIIDRLSLKAKQPVFLRKLFSDDADRSSFFTYQAGDWIVDFSRHLLDKETCSLLLKLADLSGLNQKIRDMFQGRPVNETEERPALHYILRSPKDPGISVNGQNVFTNVSSVLKKMKRCTEDILTGTKKGYTGKKIKHVVAIGIGGSNLGPEMATHALSKFTSGIDVRYVSNIDPTDILSALSSHSPDETLFIISSKTFTTTETMQNAHVARNWCVNKLGSQDAIKFHFIAVSTNKELVKKFGISDEHIFEFWDWVGGRFSMTSAIGLPVMLSIGPDNFADMLQGFHTIDQHYLHAQTDKNVPVVMAMLNYWNTVFLNYQSHGVIAYDEYLALLPDHLQQLIMESLGKRVTMKGLPVDYITCPVFFGGVGTNVQHSYFQLLHQGSGTTVPVDYIAFIESLNPASTLHDELFLNMIAQANVMAFGQTKDELEKIGTPPSLIPHKEIPGNKPSSILICRKLTPNTFGQLISMYEHMVHAWSVLLDINAFDQFGVEAGKRTAQELKTKLKGKLDLDHAVNLLHYPS